MEAVKRERPKERNKRVLEDSEEEEEEEENEEESDENEEEEDEEEEESGEEEEELSEEEEEEEEEEETIDEMRLSLKESSEDQAMKDVDAAAPKVPNLSPHKQLELTEGQALAKLGLFKCWTSPYCNNCLAFSCRMALVSSSHSIVDRYSTLRSCC